MKLSFLSFLLVLSLSVASNSYAQDPKFVFGASLNLGGDELAETDSSEINGGSGFYVYGGFDFPMTSVGRAKSGILATIGYHFDFINADDGEADFSRMPLDFAYYYKPEKVGFLIGGTYHLSPEYSEDVDGYYPVNVDFDDALGIFGEVFIDVSGTAEITFRYTNIEYELSQPWYGEPIDGSNFAIGVRNRF